MGGPLGHRGHQGHCGGAAADHHHPLAGVVEVGGPVLRVHDPPREPLGAGEPRGVPGVVAVVAGAGEQEGTGQRDRLAGVVALGVHRPAGARAVPVGPQHPVPEADVVGDAVLVGGAADVVADRVALGDGLRVGPRLEGVAEGEHVGVRPDAGITEQVPGAADRVAGLQHRVRLLRAVAAQVAGGTHAGQAGADDEHVDVFGGHLVSVRGCDRTLATAVEARQHPVESDRHGVDPV